MFAPQRTNFETKTLPGEIFGPWARAVHGTLTITRRAKTAASPQINFTFSLLPVGGGAIAAQCHAAAVNNDVDVFFPARIGMGGAASPKTARAGASSIGYGDIDLGNLGGMGIIYLVHHLMGETAVALGVSAFVVTIIINPALNHICTLCGMRFANHPTGWQGPGSQVSQRALAEAGLRGW
jgi:hypothetical protein